MGLVENAEIAESEALTTLVADFSGDGHGIGVVRDGFVVLALGLVDDAEIAEMDALRALVTDFSGDGDGLGVVRDGLVELALGLVDEPRLRGTGLRLAGRFAWCRTKNPERSLVALPSIGIPALLALNPSPTPSTAPPQSAPAPALRLRPSPSASPMPSPRRSTATTIRVILPQQRRQRRQRLAHLAVVTDLQLCRPSPAPAPAPPERPRHRQPDGRPGPSCRGTWRVLRDGLDLGLAGLEEGLGFIASDLAERGGAPESHGRRRRQRKGLVTDGNGLTKCCLGFIESVELDERIAEVAEMMPHLACRRFLGRWRGTRCKVRDGLVVLALDLVDDAEIAEIDALKALVADFSGDGEGLGVSARWLRRTGPGHW